MPVTIYTDLTRLTTEELGYLSLFLDCAPSGKVRNRWTHQRRVRAERDRRRKHRATQQ